MPRDARRSEFYFYHSWNTILLSNFTKLGLIDIAPPESDLKTGGDTTSSHTSKTIMQNHDGDPKDVLQSKQF